MDSCQDRTGSTIIWNLRRRGIKGRRSVIFGHLSFLKKRVGKIRGLTESETIGDKEQVREFDRDCLRPFPTRLLKTSPRNSPEVLRDILPPNLSFLNFRILLVS